MSALLSMLVLGVVSWVLRISFVTLLPAERLPAAVREALTHLAPAALAAIVVVELVDLARDAGPYDALPLVMAGALIGVLAYLTRNLTLACAAGLGLVVVLDVIVPLV